MIGWTLTPRSNSFWLRATAATELPTRRGMIAKPALDPVFNPRALAVSRKRRLARRRRATRSGSRRRIDEAAAAGQRLRQRAHPDIDVAWIDAGLLEKAVASLAKDAEPMRLIDHQP